MPTRRLVILCGQEGAGKSTLVRALLAVTPCGAQIDAEDVGQVNPWQMTDAYRILLHANVAALARNFWAAGYPTVLAASFLSNATDYASFRQQLDLDAEVYLIQLCATKPIRDRRRIERAKPTSRAWRDRVDAADPEDTTLRSGTGYRYLRVDTDTLTVPQTVDRITTAFPEVYTR